MEKPPPTTLLHCDHYDRYDDYGGDAHCFPHNQLMTLGAAGETQKNVSAAHEGDINIRLTVLDQVTMRAK
jgi:hypothetical protein